MPTVSLCACAAIGAPMAPAIAAMASNLLRMLCSFALAARRLTPAYDLINSSAASSFPGKCRLIRGIFWHFLRAGEPVEATGVSYRGIAREDKMQASIRFFTNLIPERFQ
jgi:hypothetical protein